METEAREVEGSPWWNTKVCMEDSEWMAENVMGFDRSVKEILELIEDDGKFSVGKAHNNHPMERELIAHMKEISNRHHLLVERYNKLSGETKNCEKNAFLTPDKKLVMPNVEGQVVFSELSLSSGGGISDRTPIEGSESSMLSSDSDSESYNSSPCESIPSQRKLKHQHVNVETEKLMRQILDYDTELKVSKEKFQFAEEEISGLKSQLQDNEAQLVSAKNQIKLHEAEIKNEKELSLMLQRQLVDIEVKVEELQESVKNRDLEIEKLNAEIQDSSANFALEKWQLESSVSRLSECLTFQEARNNELEKQCEKFVAEKVDMVRKQEALKVELRKKNVILDTLNENLDDLMAENDRVNDIHNDQILRLERSLYELHYENVQLREEYDSANKLIAELKSRIDELEKEVEKQVVLISDTAEEKMEAIRQLSFALHHFKSAYQELRDVYVISKRPTAMIS